MGKQIYYELRKFLTLPVLLLLVVTVSAHAALCVSAADQESVAGYSPAEEAAVWGELTAGVLSGQLAEAEALLEEGGQADMTSASEEEFFAWYRRLAALTDLLTELQNDRDYPDYLEEVQQQANELSASSLLSDAAGASGREAALIAAAYQTLPAEELPASCSAGVELLTQSGATEIFLLLWGAALILFLFLREKQEGQFALLQTSARSGGQVCLAKWLAMTLSLAVLFLLFYGTKAAVLCRIIGLGDLIRPVQSVSAYYECPWALSVGEFLVWFFGVKFLGLWCVVAFAAGLAALFPSVSGTVFALAVAMSGSGVLRTVIGAHARNRILRECNLIALADTAACFTEKTYLPIGGLLFSREEVLAAAAVLFAGTGIALSAVFWNRSQKRSKVFPRRGASERTASAGTGLLAQEGRKLVRLHGVPLLFVLLCGALLLSGRGSVTQTGTEVYYQVYSETLAEELTEEKSHFLTEEAERIDSADDRMDAYQAQYDAGEIGEETLNYLVEQCQIPDAQIAAFEQAQRQFDQLRQLQSEGESVEYFDERGWNRLFGAAGQRQEQISYLLICLFLLLAVGKARCGEYSFGMDSLRRTTPRAGRAEAAQLFWCAVWGALAAAVGFAVHVGLLGMPLPGWDSLGNSIQSITVVSAQTALRCPIPVYLALQLLCRMAGGALLALVLWLLASALKRLDLTLLAGGLVFLGEGVFSLLGLGELGLIMNMVTGRLLL